MDKSVKWKRCRKERFSRWLTGLSLLLLHNFNLISLTKKILSSLIVHEDKALVTLAQRAEGKNLFVVGIDQPGIILISSWEITQTRSGDSKCISITCGRSLTIKKVYLSSASCRW